MAKLIWFNLLPNGKSIKGYGTHRVDHRSLVEDWSALFQLPKEGKIRPVIAETFPLLEAAKANALLESGQVTGNIVLLAPGLLPIVPVAQRPVSWYNGQQAARSLAGALMVIPNGTATG